VGWALANVSFARMAEVNHAKIYFSGRVQGVGFRFQTLQMQGI